MVHYQVLGMYFKELHTCLVNGALLRLLLVINFPMEMVTWIKIQDCKTDCSDFDNKLLWVSVASFVSIPKVF